MARLGRRIGPGQTVRRRLWHHAGNELRRATVAKHDRVAANPFTVCMILEILSDGGEAARQIDVVAIDETKDLAGAFLQPFVDGMDLAAIFFADPIRYLAFITPDDCHRFIGAAAVYDEVFEVWIILIKHGQNRFFEESPLVERWRDDTDFRRHDSLTTGSGSRLLAKPGRWLKAGSPPSR